MPKSNLIEATMGAVVLIIAGFFLIFAYSNSQLIAPKGYLLKAKFDRADGLIVGGDVRLSGVKVGTIKELRLEPKTYLAIVSFHVDEQVRLPTDTIAEIIGNGLMGNKFLSLVPGASGEFLSPGDEIRHTQSSISLESLIGQFIFSAQKKEEAPEKSVPSPRMNPSSGVK